MCKPTVCAAGSSYCSVGNDTFAACADSSSGSSQQASTTSRTTVDGDDCVFPAVYQDQTVTDCVAIAGVDMCQVGAMEGLVDVGVGGCG